MKARIIRIGKSQGVRIPKALLEQAGLSGEVELTVEGSTLVIKATAVPEAPPIKKGTRKGKVPALPPYAKLRELAKKFPPAGQLVRGGREASRRMGCGVQGDENAGRG